MLRIPFTIILQECILKSGDRILLRFIIAYGYRNVQNVVRMLKDSTNISYIELMSCPGGCFSGPGQVLQLDSSSTHCAFPGFGYAIGYLNKVKELGTSLWEKRTEHVDSPLAKQDPFSIAHSLYIDTADYVCTQDMELVPLFEELLDHLRSSISENVTRTKLEPVKSATTSQQLKW